MKIDNFVKASGLFLKAEAVDKSPTKIFVPTSEAEVKPNERFGGERVHICGQMDETDYIFDCSKTNARTISAAVGTETSAWIGKKIKLETYKTKTSEGKMVDAINVVSIE